MFNFIKRIKQKFKKTKVASEENKEQTTTPAPDGSRKINPEEGNNKVDSSKLNAVANTADSQVSDSVELYSRGICPFTEVVRLAFAFKGIKYKFIRMSPENPPPEWFKTASPNDTVPVLRLDNEKYISESSDMLKWAEELVPTPAFNGGHDITKWVDLIKQDFIAAFPKVMGSPNPAIQAEMRPKLTSATEQLTEHLRKEDRGGPYFMGKEYTLVDILLSPFIRRIPLIEFFRGFTFAQQVFLDYGKHIESHENFKDVSMPIEKLKGILIKNLPKMPPMSGGRLQHISIRRHFAKCIKLSMEVLESKNLDDGMVEKAKDVLTRIEKLVIFIDEHSKFEEEVMYPIFEESNPGSTTRAHGEHEHEIPILLAFKEKVQNALQSISTAEGDNVVAVTKELLEPIQQQLQQMETAMHEHMAGEEKDLFPMTRNLGDKEHDTFRKIYYHCSKVREILLPYLMEVLEPHERMQYMHNIDVTVRQGDPDQWKLCQRLLKEGLPPSEFEDLVLRLPNMGLS